MTIASGSRAQLAYVLESVYGTTPATPVFQVLPDSRNSIGLEKEAIESERVRSDRQITDFRHGNRAATGEIPFEFSRDNYDTLIEAVLMGTWATDTPVLGTDELKVGTTRRSFTIETNFQDTTQYNRAVGCEFNSLSLEIAPNAMVTGTLGVVGKDASMDTAIVAGATYTPATTTRIYDGFSGSLTVEGATVAVVTALTLTLENGIENQAVVGSNTSVQGAAGRSNLTGEITAFMEDNTLLDYFDSETEVQLVFSLSDGVKTYNFDLPRITLTGGKPEVGDDREVPLTIPFQALRDDTEASQIVIQRVTI